MRTCPDKGCSTFYIKNDNLADGGTTAEVEVTATFILYTDRFVSATSTITYIDPCSVLIESDFAGNPTTVTLTNYDYDGSTLSYTETEMVVTPDFCVITYTCTWAYGVLEIDCNDNPITTFDTATGTFTFTADLNDYTTVPPG